MRNLTPQSSLESLKKEAKAWLKALRTGDTEARRRLLDILPDSPDEPGLRHVQLALAREFGLPGWADLKQALEDLALALRSHAELADLLLRSAKPWDSDKPGAARIFARISARMPGLSRHSIHAAAMFGDLDEVKRRLAQEPASAKQKGGPLDWEPLQYLAYGRLPGAEIHAVEIARLLLDAGADPNVAFDDGWENPFTLLNGVVGKGEQGRSEHPRAMDLALLFLDAGKDGFDTQVHYDDSLGPDETRWLDLLWSRSDPARWQERRYAKNSLNTLDYLLGNAVDRGHLHRAEWLLAHGADPDARHGYSHFSLHVHAQLKGRLDLVALLERHGASSPPLTGLLAFQAACMRHDFTAARAMARRTPAFLSDPGPLIVAAQRDNDALAAFLLEIGMPVDLAPPDKKRALHWCGQCGSVRVARILIDAGASIDARGSAYQGTPLGFALHFGQQAMVDLLAPLSCDLFGLVSDGLLERAEAVLRADPPLASARDMHGATPLFLLPDDEVAAVEAAELLLRHGADPGARNSKGETAAEIARNRGLADAADIIEAAG
ncbi:MAG TPA: ankyrin repeat domain-containing protein [Sphingobium sp.]